MSGRTTGTLDRFHFAGLRARYLRIVITGSSSAQPPMLQELRATR